MTPDQDTIWKRDKNTSKHHTKDSQEVSSFSAGDHKAARTRHYNKDKHKTQITKKDTQKKHCLKAVSKISLLEGFNMFNGSNPTLSSDVNQDTREL